MIEIFMKNSLYIKKFYYFGIAKLAEIAKLLAKVSRISLNSENSVNGTSKS